MFCLYLSTCAAQLKEVAGISWNELMLRAPRFTTEIDLFSEIEDSVATEASLCITCTESVTNQVQTTRCTKPGAHGQVISGSTGRGGKDLACERRPASSPVGAAFEATATSRRQLRGLKALHILKKKTIKLSRILKKETFKPSTIPHSEEEENNKKVPSKYDLYEAARFYSALKRKY